MQFKFDVNDDRLLQQGAQQGKRTAVMRQKPKTSLRELPDRLRDYPPAFCSTPLPSKAISLFFFPILSDTS